MYTLCSEKRKRPKGFICPCTGVKYHNIQTCLFVSAADSGERLQDHWSSGLPFLMINNNDHSAYSEIDLKLSIHSLNIL